MPEPPEPSRRSSRLLLAVGYGCVILLLVFSTVNAYHMQGTVPAGHMDSVRRFAEEAASAVPDSARDRNALDRLKQLAAQAQRDFEAREVESALARNAAFQRLATSLGACLILGVAVTWLSLRNAEKLTRQAVEAKSELQALSARLLEVQEEERRSLSRGLHDEIGQTLTALRLEISHALGKAPIPEVRERLKRARELAEKTVRSVRDISVLLRPSILDDLGLVPALEWQIEEFSRRSGVAFEFDEKDAPPELSDAVNTCVFRVVQEALHNCEKHAAASRVSVSLRQAGGHLTVEVRDDGRGFAAGAAAPGRKGIGLLGMRERAVRLGGRLVLDSAPGKGTRVALSIPLGGTAS